MFRKYVEKHIFRACVCEKKIVILQRKMGSTTKTQAQPNTKAAKPKDQKHGGDRSPETRR